MSPKPVPILSILTAFRYAHRLVPVSGTCSASLNEMKGLCEKVFKAYFDKEEGKTFTVIILSVQIEPRLTVLQYKIELRVRNHTTLSRPAIIQHVASWVPEGHKVALDNPEIFILIEIFKVFTCFSGCQIWNDRAMQSVCGVSIVRDYYKYSKFNVLELANKFNAQGIEELEQRVEEKIKKSKS